MGFVRDPMLLFPDKAPARIVSAVPSVTGSMIDLGLGDHLVGVTDFCPHAEGAARVGGPKALDVDKILGLGVDLVVANQEENNRANIEALCAAGVPVWLSFPSTVTEAVAELWSLASLFRSEAAMERARTLEVAVEWAEMASDNLEGMRYFCPIWEDCLESGERWWMTFNGSTFSHDVLRLAGGKNLFEGRERRYPLMADLGKAHAEDAKDRDTRYPRVTRDEISALAPEVIILPDEPYAYDGEAIEQFRTIFCDTPAAQKGRIYPIDGSLITWPGTRIARALAELPALFLAE